MPPILVTSPPPHGFDDSRKAKKRVATKKGTSPAIDVTNVTGAPSTLLNRRNKKGRGGREEGRRVCVAAGSWPRDKSALSRNYDRAGEGVGGACRGKRARA